MAPPLPAFERTTQELLEMAGQMQSNLQVPASQPFSDAFRHRAIQSRRRPSVVQYPRNTYLDIGASQVATRENYKVLRDQVLFEVKARLAEANIRIEDMSPLLFSFLLPGMGANINAWNTLINRPILLSPDMLRNMLSLSEAPTVFTNPQPGTTVFYCRTFMFFLDEFTYLLQLLFAEYQQGAPEQLYAWIRMIEHLDNEQDRSTPIWLRYLGQTDRTSWSRYNQDLSLNASSGLNRTFLQTCQNEFPEILAACDIEEFDKATIEFPLRHSQRRIGDTREQSLIGLLGPTTLLNTSAGGIETVFETNADDLNEFSELKTRTLNSLLWHTSSMIRLDDLQAYGRSVQRYTARNTASTNSALYPITDDVRDRLVNDSIPVLCQNHAILVTMGSDLGPGSYQLQQPFFYGAAQSSALVCDVLKSLIDTELGYSTSVENRVPQLQRQRFFPFIDLFPWTKKDMADLDDAMRLSRKYLQAASPMVILTFSELVTGVALGSFHTKEGLPRGRGMHQISGNVYLSKFDDDPGATDSENCCIVIPCVHPGALAHSNSKIGMRIFAKTIAVAWLAMYTSISVLQASSGLDKKAMCEKIMAIVNERTGSGTAFGNTLRDLRQQYLEDVSKSRERRLEATDLKFQRQIMRSQQVADTTNEKNLLMSADIAQASSFSRIQWKTETVQLPAAVSRCKKALEQIHMIIDCDIAAGNETSKDRKEQTDRLVNIYGQRLNTRNLPKLEFTQKLAKVRPGEMYYFAMTGPPEQSADLAHLLTFFADDTSNPAADGSRDEAATKASIKALKNFINKNIVTGNKRRQDSRSNIALAFQEMLKTRFRELSEVVHRLRRAEPLRLATYEKSPHQVIIQTAQERQLGLLQFRWLHEGQEVTIKDFPIPMGATPIFPGEERYIAFVKEGVDIRDAQGRSLATTYHRPVTLPLAQLVTRLADNPLSDKFLKLWERENKTTVDECLNAGPLLAKDGTEATTVFAYPKSFFVGTGRGLPLTAGGKTEDAKATDIRSKQCPFQPADSGWLINKFLIAKYPNGGEIDLCSPDVWPESKSAWSELRAFLQDPLWTHHPQRQNLISACSAIKLVGMSGQGAGRKGDGPKVIRGLSRLVRVLRPPMSERAKEVKASGTRRTKTILTAGSTASLPVGVIANIREPPLEAILEVTTARELSSDDPVAEDDENAQGAEDEADVDDFELTAAELAEQAKLFADFDAAKSQKDTSLDTIVPDAEDSQTKITQTGTKRKGDAPKLPASTTKTSLRKFGYIRRMAPRPAILMWSNKYDWDPDQVDDDDYVEVDVEIGGDEDSDNEGNQAKKQKATKELRGEDPNSDDDEMLIKD